MSSNPSASAISQFAAARRIRTDPPGEARPEGRLDHAAEAVDRVLGQTSLVQDDPLAAVIVGEGELLQQDADLPVAAELVRCQRPS